MSASQVTYEEWISIAFEVARRKGADFSTTQAEIQSGSSPTSEAVTTFADIWQDRKQEISVSAELAREIAEAEIQVE